MCAHVLVASSSLSLEGARVSNRHGQEHRRVGADPSDATRLRHLETGPLWGTYSGHVFGPLFFFVTFCPFVVQFVLTLCSQLSVCLHSLFTYCPLIVHSLFTCAHTCGSLICSPIVRMPLCVFRATLRASDGPSKLGARTRGMCPGHACTRSGGPDWLTRRP